MSYTTIFTIGRMNPPTPGHFHLIEKMFIKALQNRVKKIHIILSSKTDNIKNPLEPEEKRYILETYAIPWIKRRLIDLLPHLSQDINELVADIVLSHEHNRYSPNHIMSSVRHILANTHPNKSLFMTGDGFPVAKNIETYLLDRSEYPISGTLVREIARQSYPAFASIYSPLGMCHKEIHIMWSAIRDLCPDSNDNLREKALEHIRSRYELRSS